jgi:hypothetical protein
MALSKKHYEAVASIVASIQDPLDRERACASFKTLFAADNTAFSPARFGAACGCLGGTVDPSKHPPILVTCSMDAAALKEMQASISTQTRKAKRTGGLYSVYILGHDRGKNPARVELTLTL